MARPRPLHAFVATTAAAALTAGAVLLGAAPVSAVSTVSTARSAECTDALAALEAEFGDVEFPDTGDLEQILAELEAQLDADTEPLFLELDRVFERAIALGVDDEAEDLTEAVAGPLADLGAALTALQADLVTAQADLATAQGDLDTAVADGADAGTVAALEALVADRAQQVTALETDILATEDDIAFLQGFPGEVEALFVELDDLFTAFEDALGELLGTGSDIDYDRLLELLTTVSLECLADDAGAGAGSGGGTPVATPATPVRARASFTG